MKIYFGKREIEVPVKNLGFLGKGTGLMFRKKDTENLLFDFSFDGRRTIHSYFVFFDFLAVWLDGKNRVLETQVVKPFCFSVRPKMNFRKLVEIPVNRKNRKLVEFFRR